MDFKIESSMAGLISKTKDVKNVLTYSFRCYLLSSK